MGNTLARGFGHTPYGNHFTHISGMEVVLRDGRIVNTGYGALRNAQAARVFPWGLGPYTEGLFTQSDLGIVTQMGIWLLPTPESIQGFAFKVPRDEDIGRVVDAIRELASGRHRAEHRAHGQRPARDLRAAALPVGTDRRPAHRCRTRCASSCAARPGSARGTSWAGSTARGSRWPPRAPRFGSDCGKLAHVHFFGATKIRWAHRLVRTLGKTQYGQSLGKMVDSAESVYKLLIGNPTSEHLSGVFWRTRPGTDGGLQRSGELGQHVAVAGDSRWTSTHARRVLDIVEPIWREHGFSLLVTITAITERAGVAVLTVCFDHNEPGEPDRAAACYKSASTPWPPPATSPIDSASNPPAHSTSTASRPPSDLTIRSSRQEGRSERDERDQRDDRFKLNTEHSAVHVHPVATRGRTHPVHPVHSRLPPPASRLTQQKKRRPFGRRSCIYRSN